MDVPSNITTELGQMGAFLLAIILIFIKFARDDNGQKRDIADIKKDMVDVKLEVGKMAVRWEIFGSEATQAARRQGLTERHSPEISTDRLWMLLGDNGLGDSIKAMVGVHTGRHSPDDVAALVFQAHKEQLESVADVKDLDIKALYGALTVYSDQQCQPPVPCEAGYCSKVRQCAKWREWVRSQEALGREQRKEKVGAGKGIRFIRR